MSVRITCRVSKQGELALTIDRYADATALSNLVQIVARAFIKNEFSYVPDSHGFEDVFPCGIEANEKRILIKQNQVETDRPVLFVTDIKLARMIATRAINSAFNTILNSNFYELKNNKAVLCQQA